MRTSARLAGGLAGAALGVMTLGATAFADSADNDGINLINDNNISAVPVQLCGNNVAAVIGVIVPIASPQLSDCTNAPILDHNKVEIEVEHEGHKGKGTPHGGHGSHHAGF
ncbi:hypothetical protein [Actinoalloteichus spitiensis]|uniref:hypothetical protein n=1 Tax=Actinoalloteichus spitiensis TaxID=252394 RepID=UPI0003774734|nr:hypothetical protein [Actinoalloteichus spitiensis]